VSPTEGRSIMEIRFHDCADGMVMVLVGNALRFVIHPDHRRRPESLRAIIAGEIEGYRRWGRWWDA
jgi:hypothetical protein